MSGISRVWRSASALLLMAAAAPGDEFVFGRSDR